MGERGIFGLGWVISEYLAWMLGRWKGYVVRGGEGCLESDLGAMSEVKGPWMRTLKC